jgi:flavin reductase (DIM6/NTAB) family NADH-FMN oxidoreductase RutF
MHFLLDDILAQDAMYRRHFMNTLPGPRGVHLLGTKGYRGVENVAVFSSVVHIGATPPLLGFIMRPLTVPRQTYHHLLANRHFTLNTIHPEFLEQAHQTSANYPLEVSEFAATGLTPYYTDHCKAPYVQESKVKIGLTFVEQHEIKGNGTFFLVGKVIEVIVEDDAVLDSGHVDHARLQPVTVAGLDTYYEIGKEHRLAYARPKKK